MPLDGSVAIAIVTLGALLISSAAFPSYFVQNYSGNNCTRHPGDLPDEVAFAGHAVTTTAAK
jgi:hypothetical protein